MLRAIARFLGFWILAAAFIGLIADGARSIAAAEFVTLPAGQVWYWIHAPSLNLVQAGLERSWAAFLWDPVLITLLKLPAFAVAGALGLLLLWLGRRRNASGPIGDLDLR
ncbi:MAG: hypothetical protein AB7L41_04705 [Flavobacteriaceae bacterium]